MFNFLKNWFTPKSVSYTFPEPSELSNQRVNGKRKLSIENRNDLKKTLKELSKYLTPVCSHDFLKDTKIWSGDKRLSDLKKLGLASCEIRRE